MPKALERLGLGIPLRRPDSSPTYCAALVEALAKHMLFMHQQIPCTYDELRRSVPPPPLPPPADGEEDEDEDEPAPPPARPRPAASTSNRKAAKLVHALDELFALLPETMALTRAEPGAAGPSAAAESTVAALLLGSSPAAPRIVILLRIFPLAPGVPGPQTAAEAVAAARDGCLRVLRAVTIQCGALAAVNPGLCRMHLLVQAPAAALLPAAAFQPRPGLTLKLKRAHTVCVGVGGPVGGAASGHLGEDGPLRAEDWCAAPIDGLVLPPPRGPRRRAAERLEEMEVEGEADEAMMMNGHGADSPMDTTDSAGAAAAGGGPATIWFQSLAKLQAFKASGSHANGL